VTGGAGGAGDRPVAVVVGYLVRYPLAGMAWVTLNWLRAVRDLGFEPVFMEAAVTPEACWDVDAGALTDDATYGVRFLESACAASGLGPIRWWYKGNGRTWGMTTEEASATLVASTVLLNVGASSWCRELAAAPAKVLVDCDAPLTQLKLAEGREPLSTMVAAHDVLATTAVNLADGRGPFPTGGRRWLPTRPPVTLDAWPAVELASDGRWTTVTSWSTGATARFDGEVYGQKDKAYEALIDLPGHVAVDLELAVAANAPAGRLRAAGWHLQDPTPVTRDLGTFAAYVRASRGELAVAKHAFGAARSGAMNDRSLAYLASGRPVVCTDVGLDWVGPGDGLVTFAPGDVAGAAAAIGAVEDDPQRHATAARAHAERFDGATVAAELLRAAGVPVPAAAPVEAAGGRR
jgi:hypothetical protein